MSARRNQRVTYVVTEGLCGAPQQSWTLKQSIPTITMCTTRPHKDALQELQCIRTSAPAKPACIFQYGRNKWCDHGRNRRKRNQLDVMASTPALRLVHTSCTLRTHPVLVCKRCTPARACCALCVMTCCAFARPVLRPAACATHETNCSHPLLTCPCAP